MLGNTGWDKSIYGIFLENRDCLCYPLFMPLTVYSNNDKSIMYGLLSTSDREMSLIGIDTPNSFSIIKLQNRIDPRLLNLQSIADSINHYRKWTKEMAQDKSDDSMWAATFKKEYKNGILRLINEADSSIMIETDLYDIYCRSEQAKGLEPEALSKVSRRLFEELPPFPILSYEQFSRYFVPEDSVVSVSRFDELPVKRRAYGL